ncbi:MAG: Serine hydroxymethyltransferase [Candidatus Heimdallarchaeota archaeon LC_2]|nr:MAG: Serine hydroxymethyltransferase [Candidatus Heimdallarchaeota archaeon LC_2]
MIKNFMDDISIADPDIHQVLIDELDRGRQGLEMIASENYVSKAILQTNGSVLTNKYSEGYPSKRYYGGNEYIDVAENLAIDRAKELFGVDFANVQPHSGSQANMEAYFAILDLGDSILSMQLDHGGHLTHGHKVSFSGKFYDFSFYGVDKETHLLNMDDVMKKAKEVKPKVILTGYSAYSREIDFKAFREIADEVDALLMADIAHIAGLVAGKEHMNPAPYCDVITTTTHKTLRGPRGAMIMGKEEFEVPVAKSVFPGMQGGPMDMIIAGKAVCFKEALGPEFKEYAKNIKKNARALADSLQENGTQIVSGGTDNHLILIDLSNYNLGGKLAENTMDEVGIFANKNMIPFDTRSPFDPSGIRLGTAALTTRGLGVNEMKEIGELISKTLSNTENPKILNAIEASVRQICDLHPLYPGFDLLK